jgi:HlyD family secretion protein
MNSKIVGSARSQLGFFAILGLLLTGCQGLGDENAKAQPQPSSEKSQNRPISVEVAIARPQKLLTDLEYTGTTAPIREVSLRSQVEGQLQELKVDVGDAVQSGQILARINDDLLLGAVNQAKAEKTAQRSGVLTAKSQVGDALTKVEQARLQLQQAEADILRLQTALNARTEQARLEVQQTKADALRLKQLAEQGATPEQQAEQAQTRFQQAQEILRNQKSSAEQQLSQAQTTAKTAAKILRSAEAQVEIEQQKVSAAEAQVAAQKAFITQAKTRQSYSILRSPFAGKVLTKSSEPGNLVQPGTEILKLGDFSRLKINVQVSELQLGHLKLQQTVPLTLDAFPDKEFTGIVTRISPAADPRSRLVPIEITLNNPGAKIGSGLLARVSFPKNRANNIVVPESALSQDSSVFIVKKLADTTTVESRPVSIGKKANGKVEILSGLSEGETYVVRSSKSLQDNSPINLSVLSETEKTIP